MIHHIAIQDIIIDVFVIVGIGNRNKIFRRNDHMIVLIELISFIFIGIYPCVIFNKGFITHIIFHCFDIINKITALTHYRR